MAGCYGKRQITMKLGEVLKWQVNMASGRKIFTFITKFGNDMKIW